MQIEGYTIENPIKLGRAKDKLGAVKYDEHTLLAEYDRLGGLITRNGQKVKTGCFYDAKAKAPFDEPKIVYLYSIGGRVVEVPEGAELPGEVRAANILAEELKKDRTKASKGKKKVKAETETEEEIGEDE